MSTPEPNPERLPHAPRGQVGTDRTGVDPLVAQSPTIAVRPSDQGGGDVLDAPDSPVAAYPNLGEFLQVLALLVPVALLAASGSWSLVAGDYAPMTTGTGVVALGSIAALAVLLVRRAAPSVRGLGPYLVVLLVAVLWIAADGTPDTFEASRALLVLLVGLAQLSCGASLGAAGQRWLARGLVLIALAFALPAHFDAEGQLAGVLGNTGTTSEAMLAGGVVGALLVARETLLWRALGALAAGATLAYVARAPVLAGALAALVAYALVVVAARDERARRRVAAAFLALSIAAVATPLVRHRFAHDIQVEATNAPSVAADRAPERGPTGGFEVRRLIWLRCAALFADHALTGVGPGQFAAAFPAYRDPLEIEITTHGRRLAEETEVEHAHNDVITPLLEGGIVAGLAWLAFLGFAVHAAWSALRGRDATRAALGAALLALLANAALRVPVLQNPASFPVAFAIGGVLLARAAADSTANAKDARERPARARRMIAPGTLLLLVLLAPRALALVQHGMGLTRARASLDDIVRYERGVRDALGACPDSARALSFSARILESEQHSPAARLGAWRNVLAVRPMRIEALLQLGLVHARLEDVEGARAAWTRALELDPGNPTALENRSRLLILHGELEQGLRDLDGLRGPRLHGRAWYEGYGAWLALRGLEPESSAILGRGDAAWANPTPETCWQLAKEKEKAGEKGLANAWEARAHRHWAREHAAAGRFAEAVRSHRQDIRLCTSTSEQGSELETPAPVRLQLELAAALWSADRKDEARAASAGLAFSVRDLAAIPATALATLKSAALVAEPGIP